MKLSRLLVQISSFLMIAFGLVVLIVGLCGVIVVQVENIEPTLANQAAQTKFIGGHIALIALGGVIILSGGLGCRATAKACAHKRSALTFAIAGCVLVMACMLANSVVNVIEGGFAVLTYKDGVQFIAPLFFLLFSSAMRNHLE